MVSAGTMDVHSTYSLKVHPREGYVMVTPGVSSILGWIILANLLLKSLTQHQMKAKRSCNCIMTFWQYFFRKLNMLLQTSL
jgi:hypothetical protein